MRDINIDTVVMRSRREDGTTRETTIIGHTVPGDVKLCPRGYCVMTQTHDGEPHASDQCAHLVGYDTEELTGECTWEGES